MGRCQVQLTLEQPHLTQIFQLTCVVQFIRIVQLSNTAQNCLVQGSTTSGLRNQVGRGRIVVICEFSAAWEVGAPTLELFKDHL